MPAVIRDTQGNLRALNLRKGGIAAKVVAATNRGLMRRCSPPNARAVHDFIVRAAGTR